MSTTGAREEYQRGRTSNQTACARSEECSVLGSDDGGEYWAVIATLIETCKLNGVDPQAYMTDVLTKIANGHLASKLDELMPWAYAQSAAALKDVA